ncbi:MAG: DUF3316 domain-containing protein [Paludibacter sp.]|nr:DUF3316 domain-containing protein [Paludibacter sp.]
MNKLLLIALVTLFNSLLNAQNGSDKKYLLTTNTNTVGISVLSLTDPYLSPLVYTGNGIQYEHVSRRFLNTSNTNWSMQSKLDFEGGFLLNPAKTSAMTYMGVDYSWGMNYHFRPMRGLLLLAGGNCSVGFGYKDVPRNINNPGNVDLATNLNFSGVAVYDIPLRRRTLKLQLAVETPLIGWMYVPLAGASYYEMFMLGNLSNISHFSSVVNKRGINPKLTVDVPFKRNTWRFGVGYQGLQYKANNMVFSRNEMSLIIGTTFDVIKFGGRMRTAPRDFISTND